MTDELQVLERLGTHLDASDGPPTTLRRRVMAQLTTDAAEAPPRFLRRRPSPGRTARWWALPALATAVAVAAVFPVAVGLRSGGGPQTSSVPGPGPGTVAAAAPTVDTSVFPAGTSDHTVFESPEALAADPGITAVFSAEVVGFSTGRVVSRPGMVQRNVVMKVSVAETFKGPRDSDGFSYVEIPQRLCPGNVACPSVQELGKAVPPGTKVLAFGEDVSAAAPQPGDRIIGNEAGRPAGTRLIRTHPQGLLFESGTAGGPTVVGAYEKVEEMPADWRGNPSAGIEGLSARLRAGF